MSRTDKGNKIAYLVIGVVVGVCAIGWAIVVAFSEGRPGITPEVVSWQTFDRSVRVRYQISKPAGDLVHCSLVALDTRHLEVGRAQVTVPKGTSSVDARQDLPTRARATAVDLRECRTG